MLAFGQECAIYVGGTDDQDEPATMIHGIKDIAGAREISPGTGIYEGGLEAAIDGVLQGKYNPLDFRFFVGCHKYEESSLDVSVVLGKYQPVACARALALKQCISLPKPLWHEGKKSAMPNWCMVQHCFLIILCVADCTCRLKNFCTLFILLPKISAGTLWREHAGSFRARTSQEG